LNIRLYRENIIILTTFRLFPYVLNEVKASLNNFFQIWISTKCGVFPSPGEYVQLGIIPGKGKCSEAYVIGGMFVPQSRFLLPFVAIDYSKLSKAHHLTLWNRT